MSGTAGAQAVGLLILPVLARAFQPAAFGVFQLYLSILVFCTVAIALRIELTLLSKPDAEAHQTTATLFGLVLVITAILLLILTAYTFMGPGIGFPIIFLGLGLIGNGFSQVASYKLIRDQHFSRLAFLKVSQVLIYAVVGLMIAFVHPTIWGIIVADVAGRLASGALALQAVRRNGPVLGNMMRIGDLPPFVRRHWELAVISLPGALANSAGAMMTPFMIFHVFGASAAGQYGLVDRAMGVPIAMLVSAGSQVFAGRITEQVRAGNRAGVRRLLLWVIGLGAIVCGLGAVIGYILIPFVFTIAFGHDWEQAINLARILIFSYAVALVAGVINQTLVSLRAFRLQSAWDMGWPICIGAGWLMVLKWRLDLYTAVTFHALAVGGLGLVFMLLCILRLRDTFISSQPGEPL